MKPERLDELERRLLRRGWLGLKECEELISGARDATTAMQELRGEVDSLRNRLRRSELAARR